MATKQHASRDFSKAIKTRKWSKIEKTASKRFAHLKQAAFSEII